MTTPIQNDQQKIVMYGAMWCGDCIRAKKFFDRQGVDYEWIDLEQNPDAVEIVLKQNNGMRSIPTIFFPDGEVMVEPNNAQLAQKLNIQ